LKRFEKRLSEKTSFVQIREIRLSKANLLTKAYREAK